MIRSLSGSSGKQFHGWTAVVVFAFGVGTLGFLGFAQHPEIQSRPFWDKLYLTLQLFTLDSGNLGSAMAGEPQPVIPLALQVARFLAPLVTVFTAVAAVSALGVILRDQFSRTRVRWFTSGHVLICGLGRSGARLARSFRVRGEQVVAIERDPQNPAIGECRDAGVLVLTGDCTDRSLLRKAGIHKARYVVAVCGDDGVNADVALDARDFAPPRQGRPTYCYAHVADPHIGDLLRTGAITSPKAPAYRLDVFDVSERGAPLMLAEFPPFDENGATLFGPPHLLVVGVGQTGSHIVLNCARSWANTLPRNGTRLPITLIDRWADQQRDRLSLRFSSLEDICDLEAISMDVESPEFQRGEFLLRLSYRGQVSIVYVCLGDDTTGLSAALTLRGRLAGPRIPIVVRTTQRSELAAIPSSLIGRPEQNIHEFRLLDRVCTPDVLLRGMNEILAQAIHEDYLRKQEERGQTPETNPSMVPWQALPESLRESNRKLADSFGSKLETVSCEIEPSHLQADGLTSFAPEEIEILARLEHSRWCEERADAGWSLGSNKDLQRKLTPHLVPWDQLPEEIRENDRNMIRGLPAFLARAGFAIVRRQREHSSY